MSEDTPNPPGTVIKDRIMASIRDPAGRTWRDKGHAWDRDHAHKVLAACGAPAHHYEHGPTGHVQIRVPPGVDPDRLIERLRKHPHVASVEFDQPGKTTAVVSNYTPDPNVDPPVDRGIRRIDLLGALRYGLGDPSVRIAVVDTGLRPHEDIYVAPENSWSCLSGVVTQNDAYITTTSGGAPHGLMTAGCVGALANGKGIIGTGAGCTLIAIRVATDTGSMVASDMVAGLYQAAAAGAHIVSLSILAAWSSAGDTALSYLASQGIVVLCAAGNGGSAEPVWWHGWDGNGVAHSYVVKRDTTQSTQPFEIVSSVEYVDYWPPAHKDSFVVAAMGLYEWDKTLGVPNGWCWSGDMRSIWHVQNLGGTNGGTLSPNPYQSGSTTGRGPRVGVVAPDGINILLGNWNAGEWVPSTTYSQGGDGGTSFSAPIAAGAFGLAKSENPALTRDQLRDIVQHAADVPIYPDGNASLPFYQGGTSPFFHGSATLYPAKPWTNYFPNAGVLNVARARLKAWTTNPANAGQVRAYLHVIDDANYPTAITYNGPTTTINGPCFIDVDGYSSDPITSVELWIGGLRLYSGAARRFYATGSTSGPAQRLRIVAKTATATADDTRSDIAVATLTCPDFDPVGIASVMSTGPQTFLVSGKMHAGTTVTLAAAGATASDITYTDATSWQATVSDVPGGATTLTATTSDGVIANATIEGSVAAVAGLSGYAPVIRGLAVPARAALSVSGYPAGLVGVASPTGGLLGLLGYTPDLHAYVAIFAPAADAGLGGIVPGIGGLAQPPASLAPDGVLPIMRGYVISPAAVADLVGYPPSVGFAIDPPAALAGLGGFPPALLGALASPAALAGLAEQRPAHVWPSNFAVTEGGLLLFRGGSWVGLELRRFDGAQWVPVST